MDENSFSGGFSYFDHQRNVEIAVPFLYASRDPENSFNHTDYREITADIHYRKFLQDKVGGLYLSVFTRFASLSGTPVSQTGQVFRRNAERSESKIGLGLGIGVRTFFNNGIYLGASLMIGRYVSGESELFYGNNLEVSADNKQIIDIELLKIGYSF